MAKATPVNSVEVAPGVSVEVAPAVKREIKEDMSVTVVPGDSPDKVYADLANAAQEAAKTPPKLAPVEVTESMISSATPQETIDDSGGVITDDGHLQFGDKVFFADPDRRKTMPRTMNLAAGPRITKLPEPGVFLEQTKTFRGVPFRVASGAIRVDW